MQRRLVAGTVKRAAKDFAVDRHNAQCCRGEPGHEALKGGAKLHRIELAEQAAERVVTGHAMLKLAKTAQEGLFGCGNRAIATAL